MAVTVAKKQTNAVATGCLSEKSDNFMDDLKKTGQRMTKMFNITQEKIDNTLKEVRKEWK